MPGQHGSRLHLKNILQDGLRRIDILLEQKARENLLPDLPLKARTFHNRCKHGCEYKLVSALPVIQRFLSHTIPGKKQFTALPVIERKCKHPVEALHTADTPFQIGRKNHLGVTV